MGLFDFLKGRSNKAKKEQQAPKAMDDNSYLLETLKSRLVSSGYEVDRHSQYLALIVNSELEIATAIIDNPNNHFPPSESLAEDSEA
jgi:hypothetical protein